MTDRQKHPPIRYRPSAANRERIAAHAARTGLPVNRILNEALTAFWQVIEHGPTTNPAAGHAVGPLGIGITVDDRQPPGVVTVIAPGEEKTEVHSFALEPEEPAPKPKNCRHPRVRVKGVCPDCRTYVASKP